MSEKGFTSIEVLKIVAIIAALFFVTLRGMLVGEGTAIRALEKQGYSNIRIIDQDWFFVGLRGCDGRDAAKFTAEATNPAG